MKRFSFVLTLSQLFRWGAVLLLGNLAVGCAASPESVSPSDAFDLAANRPATPATLHAMARVLASQGRDRDCEYILTRAIREDPRFMPAYCALAESQLRQRRPADATATLRAGLKLAPNDAVLLNDLGMCHMLGGAYGEALAAFEAASAAAPHDARFSANRAAALGMLGRYDAALETYLKIMPPADAHYNLGVLCEARQDTRRARDEFSRAQALQDAAAPVPAESPRTARPRAGASRG